MFLLLLFVTIAFAAVSTDGKSQLRKRQSPPLPSGPAGGSGKGVYQRPDGAYVYDFWSSTTQVSTWGPGGSTTSYCQQLDAPDVPSFLSEIWFGVTSAVDIAAWATVSDFTGQTLGELLYNASSSQNVTAGSVMVKFPNGGVKLSSSGTYLWCMSAFQGESQSTSWYATPTLPSPSGWYNNDITLDESGMTNLTYPLTYYAVFSSGASDSTCTKCTDKGDYWCLDTDACSSELPKDCPDYVQSPSLCPVNCESFQTCAECTDQNSACEYCISSGEGSCHASGDVSGACSSTRISKSQYCPAQ